MVRVIERLFSFVKHGVATDKASSLPRAPRQIAWIGVPTRNRPENLQLCVQSFAECVREHGRNVKLLVVDQTENHSQSELNRQNVKAIAATSGVEIWFAGPHEVREYARLLSEHAKLPLDMVSFACCGDEEFPVQTGANRNTLLLATAGEMMIQVDDDTICEIEPCPEAEEGLAISSEYSCTEHWFLAGDESLQFHAPSKLDICALHEELLGKSIEECIEDYGLPTQHSVRWTDKLRRKWGAAQRKVLATSIGVSGDTTIASGVFWLQSTGAQRDRMISSESAYREIMSLRLAKRAARMRTISDKGLVSGTNFAVDNRTLLPPFSPVQQCQDSIFTVLLSHCFNASVGFLPWMIQHKRPTRHDSSPEIISQRSYLRSGDMIWLMIPFLAAKITSTAPQTRLIALGKLFTECGSASQSEFQDMVRNLAIKNISRHHHKLESVLQRYQEQPDFWASDLKQYCAWMRKSIEDPELDIPNDLSDVFGNAEARVKLQQLAFRFGQLLKAWPAMHLAARELRTQGINVGTKL